MAVFRRCSALALGAIIVLGYPVRDVASAPQSSQSFTAEDKAKLVARLQELGILESTRKAFDNFTQTLDPDPELAEPINSYLVHIDDLVPVFRKHKKLTREEIKKRIRELQDETDGLRQDRFIGRDDEEIDNQAGAVQFLITTKFKSNLPDSAGVSDYTIDGQGRPVEFVYDRETGKRTHYPMSFRDGVSTEEKIFTLATMLNSFAAPSTLELSIERNEREISRLHRQLKESPAETRNYAPYRTQAAGTTAISSYLDAGDMLDVKQDFDKRGGKHNVGAIDQRQHAHMIDTILGVKTLTSWTKAGIGGRKVDQTGRDIQADMLNVATGLDFRVNRTVAVGASIRLQRTDSHSKALNTNLKTDLFGAALNANFYLPYDVNIAVLGGLEFAQNNSSINGFTGSYNYKTWLASARASKTFVLSDNWWIQPMASISWSHTKRDTFINSARRVIPGESSSASVAGMGVRFGKKFLLPYGDGATELATITPSLGISGYSLLDEPDSKTLTNGATFASSEKGITLDGKVSFGFRNGIVADLSGRYTYAENDERSWSLSGRFAVPVARFLDVSNKSSVLSFSGTSTAKERLRPNLRLDMPF